MKYTVPTEKELERVPEEIVVTSDVLDKLSDNRRVGGQKKFARHEPGWYPIEKRISVATAFVAGLTSSNALADLSGVPQKTIERWKREDWWYDICQRIRLEKDDEFDTKMSKIIDKTLDTIMDRVENGDFHLTKLGDIVRKPVSGRDAAMITSVMVDKRNLIRGRPLEQRQQKLTENEQLAKLADQFKKFIKAKEIPALKGQDYTEVIDVQVEVDNNIPSNVVEEEVHISNA